MPSACRFHRLPVCLCTSVKISMCYARYTGTDGVYTYTVAYEKDPSCLACGSGVPVEVDPSDTLQQVCASQPRAADKILRTLRVSLQS